MSRKYTPQFADPKGVLIEGPGAAYGNAVLVVQKATPVNGQAGFREGCIFINATTPAVVGTIVYVNDGTNASATWVNLV